MRDHLVDNDASPAAKGRRRQPVEAEGGAAAQAMKAGQLGAVGKTGMLHLQRAAGNSGVAAAVAAGETSAGDAEVQREMDEGKEGVHGVTPTAGTEEQE